ncbi:hypothetical protein GCM10023168_26470 [Fodinibacter luteus]|uniref:Peptidase S1 domain-containing protein n=2 Tax=Fodinibacter luteus TaxID=552064 RepID=A0ABP8KKI0_9MICO
MGVATLAAGLLAALSAAPANAVTDGALDGDGHPYVGLMVARDASGAPLWRCSGTLISANVYLTAGHCTEAPAKSAVIYFAADVQSLAGYPNSGYDATGTTYTHPDYNPDAFFVRDLGVVVLDKPVDKVTYGALPRLDSLDALKTKRGLTKQTFTSVGYGLQKSFPDAAAWKESALKIRMVATPRLIQLNAPGFTGDFSMLLSNNANTGGTCFGDSGGPNFLGNTNVVAGVTSFGMNSTCGGTGGVFRMDRSWALDWVNTFLG